MLVVGGVVAKAVASNSVAIDLGQMGESMDLLITTGNLNAASRGFSPCSCCSCSYWYCQCYRYNLNCPSNLY